MNSFLAIILIFVFFISGFWVGVHWQLERFKREFR